MSQVHTIKLSRFDQQPWGFRLHGGTDFGTPLLIQKVNISSLSEAAGLEAGDIILQVNGENVDQYRHKEVQEKIIRAGNNFTLTVNRGGVLGQALKPGPAVKGAPPRHPEWQNTLERDQAGAADNAEDFTRQFMAQLRGDVPAVITAPTAAHQFSSTPVHVNSSTPVQVYSSTPVHNGGVQYQGVNGRNTQSPVLKNGTVRTQTPVQNKQLMSRQYNSPQYLYSEENIQEVLSQQAEVLANGVKGEEGSHTMQQPRLVNSETLRMVKELDIRGPEPEPGIDIDPSQVPSHYKGLANKNVQSATFKMLQKALEMGDVDSVDFAGKVQAPKLTSPQGANNPRTYSSPSNTLNRRLDSAAAVGQSRQNITSTTGSRNLQEGGKAESQARMTVNPGDDIITTSCKPKKVGNSFQWPPVNQDQGPTACPMYINPGSRNNSPAPRGFDSPTPALRGLESPAPASRAYGSPAPASRAYGSPAPGSRAYGSPTPTPRGLSSPAPTSNLRQTTGNTARHEQDHFAVHQHNGNPNGGANVNGTQQYSSTQQQQPQHQYRSTQQTVQQSSKQEWSSILEANSVSSAGNASDFTKMFLNQNTDVPKIAAAPCAAAAPSAPSAAAPAPSAAGPARPAASAPSQEGAAAAGQNMSAPKRGRGVLTQQRPGMRVPMCGACDGQIRGPFITAMGRTWCPAHFLCSMEHCRKSLQEVGFVEEKGLLYCEDCYAKYLAPECEKCKKKIIGNCLKAMGKTFHPECFNCAYCGKLFANSPFYLEDGLPYCEEDWNELFTTKCVSCGFPIEAGDRWVEALNNNYHSQCFNCTLCKKNLEGQSFFVKAGKPFCKGHAKM